MRRRRPGAGGTLRASGVTCGRDDVRRAVCARVAEKDWGAVRNLLGDDGDFRALTPRRFWEASTPDDVVGALRVWIEDGERVTDVLSVETDRVVDRERVGYRLRVATEGGDTEVEQQAYYETDGGPISWMRVVCSGNRPLDRGR